MPFAANYIYIKALLRDSEFENRVKEIALNSQSITEEHKRKKSGNVKGLKGLRRRRHRLPHLWHKDLRAGR